MTLRDYVGRWCEACQGLTSTDRALVRLVRAAVAADVISEASIRFDGQFGGRDPSKALAALERLWRANPGFIDRALNDYFAALVAAADREPKKDGRARKPARPPEPA